MTSSLDSTVLIEARALSLPLLRSGIGEDEWGRGKEAVGMVGKDGMGWDGMWKGGFQVQKLENRRAREIDGM